VITRCEYLRACMCVAELFHTAPPPRSAPPRGRPPTHTHTHAHTHAHAYTHTRKFTLYRIMPRGAFSLPYTTDRSPTYTHTHTHKHTHMFTCSVSILHSDQKIRSLARFLSVRRRTNTNTNTPECPELRHQKKAQMLLVPRQLPPTVWQMQT